MVRTRVTPPRRRGDAVVRRVLDSALKELARVGLERLSVPEVAALAGVNKTSVYRRWATKQDLVRAALAHSMGHVHDVPDTGALASDLAALAGVVAAFITSPKGMGVVRTVFADGHSAAMKAQVASMWQEAGGDLPRVVVERAIARGELSPGADVELLLFTIAGALLHRIFIEREATDPAWRERLAQLVIHGASPRGKPSRR
jgi:AcrR family transcriptional regulator